MQNTVKIRIAVVGNQGAYGYRLASWIRAYGQTCDLILIKSKDQHTRDQIEHVDRDSSPGMNWIHEFSIEDRRYKELRYSYDLIISLGPSGLKASTQIFGIPVVHFAMGTDLHEMPFLYIPPKNAILGRIQRASLRFLGRKTHGHATALHMRKALSHVDGILTAHQEISRGAFKLGVGSKLRLWAFPEDVRGNRKRVDKTKLNQLNARYAKYDRVLLWLSRVNLTAKSGAQYKGLDQYLLALKKIISTQGQIRAVFGTHGSDVGLLKSYVTQQGLAEHVDFVPHLPFWELLTYLSIDNAIVCDSLHRTRNVPGGLSREAIGLGSALVTNLDQRSVIQTYGGSCPIANASDAESCFSQLTKLIEMTDDEFLDFRQGIGDWASQHLDYRAMIPRLIGILNEVVHFHSIGRIDRGENTQE